MTMTIEGLGDRQSAAVWKFLSPCYYFALFLLLELAISHLEMDDTDSSD
jgi:hypothetical protein